MRRRLLTSGVSGTLTLSPTSLTLNGNGGSYSSVYVYLNGTILKDNSVTLSTDTSWITSMSYYSNYGYFAFYYDANESYLTPRSGKIIVSYKGLSVELPITQNLAALSVPNILLDNTNGSVETYQLNFNGSDVNECFDIGGNIPSWLNVSCNNGLLTFRTVQANTSSSYRFAYHLILWKNGVVCSNDFYVWQRGDDIITVDGHPCVEMNNGLKVATCNVGASSVDEVGNYYQWGAGATTFECNTTQYWTGATSTADTIPMQYDTARQVMGGGWRMPTSADTRNINYIFNGGVFEAQYHGLKCSAAYNSANGHIAIFPFFGYYNGCYFYENEAHYWVSGVFRYDINRALCTIHGGGTFGVTNYSKNYGMLVRGVHD